MPCTRKICDTLKKGATKLFYDINDHGCEFVISLNTGCAGTLGVFKYAPFSPYKEASDVNIPLAILAGFSAMATSTLVIYFIMRKTISPCKESSCCQNSDNRESQSSKPEENEIGINDEIIIASTNPEEKEDPELTDYHAMENKDEAPTSLSKCLVM